jgi:hypothetical protein
VLNLQLPISKSIPALQETINIFKKCTGALIKSSEKLKASEKSKQLLLAEQINISLNLLIRAVAEFEIEDKASGKKLQVSWILLKAEIITKKIPSAKWHRICSWAPALVLQRSQSG